jgi:hypothetical protein
MFSGLLPPVSSSSRTTKPETLPHVNGATVSEYYDLAALAVILVTNPPILHR